MPRDDSEVEPPYTGPWVKFDGDGIRYSASIDPILPTGDGSARTFGSRYEAWGQALEWARTYRLPLRDLTDRNANKLQEK